MTQLMSEAQAWCEHYPYSSEGFARCWWQYLAPKYPITRRMGDLMVLRQPYANGLLAYHQMGIVGWNNDALVQDLTEERVQDMLVLGDTSQWDFLRTSWAMSRRHYQAFQRLEAQGYELVQAPLNPDYVIRLPGDWETYLAALSRTQRSSMTRTLKKAAPLEPRLVHFQGADAIEPFLDQFFRYHIPYWHHKTGYSYFEDACERQFIVALARYLESAGQLLLYALELGGELVNLTLGIRTDNVLYVPLAIVTGRQMDYYPGIVSLCYEIQMAMEMGLKAIRLCPGDEQYKPRFATHVDNRYALLVANPRSMVGRACVAVLTKRLVDTHLHAHLSASLPQYDPIS